MHCGGRSGFENPVRWIALRGVAGGDHPRADVDTSGAADTVIEEFVKKITKSRISRYFGNFTTIVEVMCDHYAAQTNWMLIPIPMMCVPVTILLPEKLQTERVRVFHG